MALFARKRVSEQPNHENPYWMSFSDMMSGMLIIFILVCIALLYQLTQMKEKFGAKMAELDKSNKVRSVLVHEIKNELAKKSIEVYVADNDTVLRIPAGVLSFDHNRPEIKTEYEKTATDIGRALYEAITKDKRWEHLDTVFVEGHADSTQDPNNPRRNWELSAERAVSVWRHWLQNKDFGLELGELRNKDKKYLFSVSGYADTRPPEEGGELKSQKDILQSQRRIDIRFTTRQPSLQDYEGPKRALEGLTSKP